jgi:hypothetical protein
VISRLKASASPVIAPCLRAFRLPLGAPPAAPCIRTFAGAPKSRGLGTARGTRAVPDTIRDQSRASIGQPAFRRGFTPGFAAASVFPPANGSSISRWFSTLASAFSASPPWPTCRHRSPRLLADLAIAHGDARYARLLRSLARVKLLILDDWGPEALTSSQARDMLEIVEDRYDNGSLIITSQVPIDRCDAILDRKRCSQAACCPALVLT